MNGVNEKLKELLTSFIKLRIEMRKEPDFKEAERYLN